MVRYTYIASSFWGFYE